MTAAQKLRELACKALDALNAVYEHRRRHAPTTEWHARRSELDNYFIDTADAALAQVAGALDEAKRRFDELMKYVDDAKKAAGTDTHSGEPLADLVARLISERDDWKRRAASHGCNTEEGDPDCG